MNFQAPGGGTTFSDRKAIIFCFPGKKFFTLSLCRQFFRQCAYSWKGWFLSKQFLIAKNLSCLFCTRNFADFYFPLICKWIILRVEKIFVIVLNIPQIGSESAMFLRCFYVVNIEQLSHMFISHSE